jgi:hypothetical protein
LELVFLSFRKFLVRAAETLGLEKLARKHMRQTARRHEVLFGFGLGALMGRLPERGWPLWRQVAGVFCYMSSQSSSAVKEECTCFLFFMGGSDISSLSEFSESE